MPKKTSDSENKESKDKTEAKQDADIGAHAKEMARHAYTLARNVQRDTVAYVVLVLGLLLLPWLPLYGGALVGIVFGVYFSDEMLNRVKGFRSFLEKEGMAKSMVCAGAVLALLITVPTLVLGAVAAVGVLTLLKRSASKD